MCCAELSASCVLCAVQSWEGFVCPTQMVVCSWWVGGRVFLEGGGDWLRLGLVATFLQN